VRSLANQAALVIERNQLLAQPTPWLSAKIADK
jgi:hypothetical protein